MTIRFHDGSFMTCTSIMFSGTRLLIDGYRVVETSEVKEIIVS